MRTLSQKERASGRSSGSHTAGRIVAHARTHFFAHGFRSVTMDDLAEELGMSKKTLYAHFSSKDALLEAVIRNKFHSVETDLGKVVSGATADFGITLHQLLECLQRHLDEIQPPFIRDIRRESPEMFKLIEALRRDHIQRHFGKLFDDARRRGFIRKDVPPAVIIEILLGAVQAIMNPQRIEELGLTPKSAFMAIISVVLEGVLIGKRKEGK